ncbi:MAG: hypothetical protein M3Q47_04815 [Actinomycetota bacterium]|nr:hypothetical protein [Actinomycetota bacterium]
MKLCTSKVISPSRPRRAPAAPGRAGQHPEPARAAQQAAHPGHRDRGVAWVVPQRAQHLDGQQRRRGVAERDAAEVGEEGVAGPHLGGEGGVDERVPGAVGEEAEAQPVAARVAELDGLVGQRAAQALLELRPHRVDVHRRVGLLPAAVVTHVGGRLEAHHRVTHGQDGAHGVGHLAEVGRRDRHVVGQVEAQPGLGAQVAEHLHEARAVRVQLGLGPRPDGAAAPAHQRVDVRSEAHPVEPQRAVRTRDQRAQVPGAEVAVGHRHR